MLAIVTPVFDDWISFASLVHYLDQSARLIAQPVTVVVVDDGSTQATDFSKLPALSYIRAVEVITLNCNLGHQRAIAIGISECVRRGDYSAVLVMDSDGEDSPSDIVTLVETHMREPQSIIVAQRTKRSEGTIFKVCYVLYKNTFRWLTNEAIDFGNFCLLPISRARTIAYMPESWNHIAAAIVKSRCPLRRIATERAKRYAGKSTMNLIALITHGLSAVSVFSDRVLTRLLLLTSVTCLLALSTGTAAILLRLYSSIAIPGWATNVFGLSCLLFFQSLTLLVVIVFISLNNRSNAQFIPGAHSSAYISHIAKLPVQRTTEARGEAEYA